MISETVKATPRVNAGGPRNTSLAASAPDTANLAEKQRQTDAVGPSPDAIAGTDEFLLDEICHALRPIASHTASDGDPLSQLAVVGGAR